ncbi:Methyltransferase domain [Seminavis robusta]|uniref:Methyltransferase domain n=1 Tax=Seminavis robusta TaxID=568900 RepID=A0A9N8EED1_9STRA|nr:Methyltransferase domain [Seminavis robusta]|eukprot:Sro968_g226080.1 Methyltransferase domain (242) ;mRNA; f:34172-34897
MIPGYDHFLELMGDIVASIAAVSEQNNEEEDLHILVIGPGYGEEMIAMARALPDTSRLRITAYEPSEAMVEACRHMMAQQEKTLLNLADQVTIIPTAFGATTKDERQYHVVTILNVLHLMPPEEQVVLFEAVAKRVAPGGMLLVSGGSLPEEEGLRNLIFRVVKHRWRRLGIDDEAQEKIFASSGKTFFDIQADNLQKVLQKIEADGDTEDEDACTLHFSPLKELQRGYSGNVVWFSERLK